MKEGRSATAGTLAKTPNFLVIGAAKCGTTAMWHYLQQHPEVYMAPTKHTRFFAFETENPGFFGPPPKDRGPAASNPKVPYAITDFDAYHALFAGITTEKAAGEASHSYLYQPRAVERIWDYEPEMRLIAILRNPAERAFSHFSQMVRDGREPISDFSRALDAEAARVRDHWWPDFHYVQIGLYHDQLVRYFDRFPREQVRVYLYEDLNRNPLGVLWDMFRFLDVDDGFVPEITARYNASGVPRNKVVHLALQRLRQTRPFVERLAPEEQCRRLLRLGSDLHNRNLTKPRLLPWVRRSVTGKYFREDILKLQTLIRRDLSAWMG